MTITKGIFMKLLTFTAFLALSISAQAKVYMVDCRNLNDVCTMEYSPTECIYDNRVQAEGSNRCVAISRIEAALCSRSKTGVVKVDTQKMQCLPGRVF